MLIIIRNLVKWAENAIGAKINHIYFENDSLVFYFVKSKDNQEANHIGLWHAHTNPLWLYICPILSLARYVFLFPEIFSSGSKLFSKKNQYKRYISTFFNVLKEFNEELKVLGTNTKELSRYSIRKGIASIMTSEYIISPPIISLHTRAG